MHGFTDRGSLVEKAKRYCARQERCQQEVRDKLYTLGAHREEVESTLAELIAEGFLNEARFAEHYALSKLRQKGWGKQRIKSMLKGKRVSGPCIDGALAALDEKEYEGVLCKWIVRRMEHEKDRPRIEQDLRVKRYLHGKGFDSDPVARCIEAYRSGDTP